jgi:hypothetical protein
MAATKGRRIRHAGSLADLRLAVEHAAIAAPTTQCLSSTGIMKLKRTFTFASLVVLGSLAVTPWPSTAYADDCYAVGVKLAADKGGQLARAIPAVQDGKPICRIVILLPGKDGSRPRRAEFIVPADKD